MAVPSGPAMPGGAIPGFLLGFITYSLPLGYGIDYLIKRRIAKRKA